MSIISRVVDTIVPDVNFDLLRQGGEALLAASQQSATQAVLFGGRLGEVYASRLGIERLPAGISSNRQPDTVFDGVFVGANGQTFPPTTPLNQIPAVQPRNGPATDATIIYINGINTTKDGQAASLQAIADRTGARVIGIHNATQGMVSDLRQCITDKLDLGRNPPVDTLADTVYKEIQAGRTVHLMAHSQGALITSRALRDVYQRLRIEDGLSGAEAEQRLGQVSVETFGGAAGHYQDGPQYVHYINRDDPVPSLFGLGWDIDRFNPTLDAGRGAQVHWFTDRHLNPIASHSFEDVYLERRVPFDRARRGDFD